MNKRLLAALTAEIWAMEERSLEAFFEKVSTAWDRLMAGVVADEQAGLFDEAEPRSRMETADGTATIKISGVLMKSVPKIFRWFGIEATSYRDIQDDLAKAIGDSSIKAIRLAVDSPGGQVAGVKEAADAIATARGSKPVTADIEDLCASAAYWLASQASQVSASPNAQVGSIGVYSTYIDSSKAAEDAGFKVHLVASGPHKGMGVPGTKITEEQLQVMKGVVMGMAENFMADVARGRRREPEKVRDWANGQVWLARDAKTMGLIDGITNSESVKGAAGVRPAAESNTTEKEEETMTMDPKQLAEERQKASDEARAQERKRIADLKAAFPEDPSFALEHVEKGSTLLEAKAAYADVLRERQKAADLDARKPKPAPGAPASVAGGAGGSDAAGSTHRFMVMVEEHMKAAGCSKLEAMSYIAGRNRKLYSEWEASADAKAIARRESGSVQR